MISVCYTVRNRTNLNTGKEILPLFFNSVMSVVDAFKQNNIEYEIVISDWKSTDTDYEWLPKNNKFITIDPEIIQFSRGYGRNIAAENSSYDNILFLDTDVIINSFFINRCNDYLNKNFTYFPICWSIAESDKDKCFLCLGNNKLENKKYSNKSNISGWRSQGTGLCCVNKNIWKNCGKWPDYKKWGKEDTHFYNNIRKKYKTIRQNDNGIVHCWHPINRG